MNDHDSDQHVRRRLDRLERDLEHVHQLLDRTDDGSVDRAPSARLDFEIESDAMGGESAPTPAEPTGPNIDVLDDGDRIVVIVDLPGVEEADIDLRLTDDGLAVDTTATPSERSGTYLVHERPQAWQRTVHLPETVRRSDESVASIEYQHGRLTVVLDQRTGGDELTID